MAQLDGIQRLTLGLFGGLKLGTGVEAALGKTPNAAAGTVVLDGDGKVPAANLPEAGASAAFNIIAMGSNTLTGTFHQRFVPVPALTSTCKIFLTLEGDQPAEAINVLSRTLTGTKGFTVEGMHDLGFNWMVVEAA